MKNITKDEFDKISDEVYQKSREALLNEMKKKMDEQASADTILLAGIMTCLDISCRYPQEILSRLLFEDSKN